MQHYRSNPREPGSEGDDGWNDGWNDEQYGESNGRDGVSKG